MSFRVGITAEYLAPENSPISRGLAPLREAGCEVEYLPRFDRSGADPAVIDRFDAVIASSSRYPREALLPARRLALIQRYGVGYDAIDVPAATEAGIMVGITRGEPDRPVAEGALTLMLALSHNLVLKDRITRAGRWGEKPGRVPTELRDRVIGLFGFGAIARELARLLQPFGAARLLACDPYADPARAAPLGVELVPLDTLVREADIISIHCHLSDETRGLIGEREIALLKPDALIVNTARGPIIDQDALTRALQDGRIGGAALDVFREEPIAPDDPLLTLDNVIVAPHSVAVTEELYRDYSRSAVAAILALRRGEAPAHVVNREVIGTPQLESKLAALRRTSS